MRHHWEFASKTPYIGFGGRVPRCKGALVPENRFSLVFWNTIAVLMTTSNPVKRLMKSLLCRLPQQPQPFFMVLNHACAKRVQEAEPTLRHIQPLRCSEAILCSCCSVILVCLSCT